MGMSQDKPTNPADDLIDANLRRVYDDVLNERVPDRFAKLLEQLQAKEGAVEPAGDDGGERR